MSKINTIGDGFQSRASQDSCSVEGLRGFPVKLTYSDFNNVSEEPSFQFRPLFQARPVWSYDSARGSFDNGAYAQSTFYMQGKTYNVAAVRVANRGTHWADVQIPELQVWGQNSEGSYAVICIPLIRGSPNMEGFNLERMFKGDGAVDLLNVFPKGDDVNIYFYVSCNPYVAVDKDYKPVSYGSTNVHVIFFARWIALEEDMYKKYVENSIRPAGIPIELVPKDTVYSEYMETDTARTVKITKVFDTTAELKKRTVYKKVGFGSGESCKKTDVKVFEVSAESLKDGAYVADMNKAEDLGAFLEEQRKQEEKKRQGLSPVIPKEPAITPGGLARTIGVILGVLALILIGGFIWKWYRRPLVEMYPLVVPSVPAVAPAVAPAVMPTVAPNPVSSV